MTEPDYLLVTIAKGPAWDHAKGRREQHGWDEHAAFMDALVDEGFIVLGGPVGDREGEHTMHVVTETDETKVRDRFAQDPWAGDLLVIERIVPWHTWLKATR